jgi:phosphoglycerate dehydrogenase-like enzyme
VDVFEQEPAAAANPLLALDNVIVTPHAIAHTDEFFRTSGRSAANAALAIRGGEAPPYVVNREVLDTSLFHERLERRRAEAGR